MYYGAILMSSVAALLMYLSETGLSTSCRGLTCYLPRIHLLPGCEGVKGDLHYGNTTKIPEESTNKYIKPTCLWND